MKLRKIKLSDTQARVIAGSTLGNDGRYTVWTLGKSRAATFRKLYDLGLITAPIPGSQLTVEGLNVRTSIHGDLLIRVFHVGEISHDAYKPVEATTERHNASRWVEGQQEQEDRCPVHSLPISKCADLKHSEPEKHAVTVIRIHGDEHVHRTGCRDIKISATKAGIWADEPWDFTATDRVEVAVTYWGDVATDAGPEDSPEWWDALEYNNSAMTYHNCLSHLPKGTWPHKGL